MAQTLQQRQREYENLYDQKILPRVPVVVVVNGRLFSKVTKDITKPFCHKTIALMNDTMLSLVKQVDGVVFAYQYSDKIILIIRNDQTLDTDPWFGNDVQKLSSVVASIATYEFINNLWEMNDAPNLQGSITFSAKAFAVPNNSEAINYLIYRQYHCLHYAINEAVLSLLRPRYGKETHLIIDDKSSEQRKEILSEAGVNFDDFPTAYKHGTAAYLTPKWIETAQGQIQKHKWVIDFEIPLFSEDKNNRLKTIINTGSDLFRPERDLNDAV